LSLSQEFNQTHSPEKVNDQVLKVNVENISFLYDFRQRLVTATYRYGNDKWAQVTPFSQLDREVLVDMRDALVHMGGKPKELPAEAPSLPRPQKGLNV